MYGLLIPWVFFQDICYLDCMSSDNISWWHRSLISWTCGLQVFLASVYTWNHHHVILIYFRLLVMYPISKSHVVYLVSCLCLFLYFLVLKYSTSHKCYGILFSSALFKSFFGVTMQSGFTLGSKQFMHSENFICTFWRE